MIDAKDLPICPKCESSKSIVHYKRRLLCVVCGYEMRILKYAEAELKIN